MTRISNASYQIDPFADLKLVPVSRSLEKSFICGSDPGAPVIDPPKAPPAPPERKLEPPAPAPAPGPDTNPGEAPLPCPGTCPF
jgi:hypothetical protein